MEIIELVIIQYNSVLTNMFHLISIIYIICFKDRRGRDRMVIGFTITYTISAYHH
jgi:hypothetical protein